MKRVLFLIGGVPALAGLLMLSACGDGVEPRPPRTATPTSPPLPTNTSAPTRTPTPRPPTATPTLPPPTNTPTMVPTGPTGTPTPTSEVSETPTQEPTETPTSGAALCGNGIIESGEQCDDGGTCLNGSDNGARCPANQEGGVDCAAPGLCRPDGGDTCASNCTDELVVPLPLGDKSTTQSFAIVQGQSFSVSRADLRLFGSLVARTGHPRFEQVTTTDGRTFNPGDVPVVQSVNDNRWTPETMEGDPGSPNQGLPPIEVPPSVACACVRGFAVKSCGADTASDAIDCTPRCVDAFGGKECAGGGNTKEACVTDADCPGGLCGQFCNPNLPNPDQQCVEGFSCLSQDDKCTEAKACAYVHGPGNQASGTIGCGGTSGPTGEGIDYQLLLDSATSEAVRTFSGGQAGPGNAVLTNSTAIASIVGSNCEFDPSNADNGPDGLPCTDDDPDKNFVNTIPLTTGTAEAKVINANGGTGVIMSGLKCGATDCDVKVTGVAFDCEKLPDPSGAAIVGAFGSEDFEPLGDVGIPTNFVIK